MAKKKAKKLGVNPWTNIWFKPRETIRQVVKFNPKHRFVILSGLYGLPMLLHMAQNLSLGEKFTVAGISLSAIVLAIFVGMLGITIATWLLHWTGKWIGGEADFIQVRTAVSWSNVPNIISIIAWGFLIYNFRESIFLEDVAEKTMTAGTVGGLTWALLVQSIASIWSFVILVKGLGQVQGFSAWKGVLNVLIPFFMVGILLWLISWLLWIGNGMIQGM